MQVIHESLKRYFGRLGLVGYQNYNTVDKILTLSFINKIMNDELMGTMLTSCDLKTIEKVLYKLYGSECTIPFPHKSF